MFRPLSNENRSLVGLLVPCVCAFGALAALAVTTGDGLTVTGTVLGPAPNGSGQDVAVALRFTNHYMGSVKVTDVVPECSCTMTAFDRDLVLSPLETKEVMLTWRLPDKAEAATTEVTVKFEVSGSSYTTRHTLSATPRK